MVLGWENWCLLANLLHLPKCFTFDAEDIFELRIDTFYDQNTTKRSWCTILVADEVRPADNGFDDINFCKKMM